MTAGPKSQLGAYYLTAWQRLVGYPSMLSHEFPSAPGSRCHGSQQRLGVTCIPRGAGLRPRLLVGLGDGTPITMTPPDPKGAPRRVAAACLSSAGRTPARREGERERLGEWWEPMTGIPEGSAVLGRKQTACAHPPRRGTGVSRPLEPSVHPPKRFLQSRSAASHCGSVRISAVEPVTQA